MKKIISGIVIIGLLIFLINHFFLKNEIAPTFIDRNTPPSLVEILEEPASFTYGSSIDVWYYQDSTNQIEEIAVTGHADSRTCGLVSSLFFNTYLQKYEHPDDFFVAGAGRLVNEFDDSLIKDLETRENVKLYLEKHDEKQKIEFLFDLFGSFPTYSETEQSPLEEYQTQLQEIEKELEELENDPDVKKYKLILYTEESFSKFLEECNRYSSNSGLVRVHQLPVEIIAEIEERIKTNITTQQTRVVKFSDILEKYGIEEGVVWTETYRLDNHEPLVIRLSLDELSKESFEKAKAENKNEVEIAMVGDAKRRIDFFSDQIIEINQQEAFYAQLSSGELNETIYLNQCISPEGLIYDCDGSYVTKKEYFQERIPGLIKFLKGNIEDLEVMMAELEKDKDLEQDSKIEAINHMTLIDAMLRDWNLPVGSSQKAFDNWRKEQRERTWKKIEAELSRANIPLKALESENIVFSISTKDNMLEIKPMQILDLSNSIVVLHPKLNIAKVESAWSQRERIPVDEELAEVPEVSVSPLVMDQISKISQEQNSKASEEMMLDLLNNYPKQTFLGLEQLFTEVSDSYEVFKKDLLEEVEPSIMTKEVLTTIDRFSTNPKYEDDLIAYTTDFRNMLISYPDAPVDIHLSFAIKLGGFLAEIQNMQNTYTSSGSNVTAWEVIEKCERSTEAFKDESKIITERLEIPFSLADEIRDILKLIKTREYQYYKLIKSSKGFPEESSLEFKKLSEETAEITLFEREAQNYLSTLNKLKNHTLGENAALELAINESPNIQLAIEELINATDGSLTGKNLFFLSALDRLKHHMENDIHIDNLARVQIYHTIQTGCENILKELKYFDHRERTISGYDQLYSRFLYESGDFGLAIDNLFDSLTSVVAYHPQLFWKVLEDDWTGYPYPDDVEAVIEANALIVEATLGNQKKTILYITNLSPEVMNTLRDKINSLPNDLWRYDGKVSSKLLMAKVPVRKELQNLYEVISAPKVKLAMLKAMVYASIPPGIDLVKPGGEDDMVNETKKRNDKLLVGKIADIKVPSLEEFEKKVSANLESQIQ